MNSPITNADASAISQVVVFPPEPGIGVLGVAPPLPIGYKLQEDGALGVNIHMVQGDRDGLLVYILAYTNMAEGDAIEVFIDTANAPVAKFTVTDAHFDDQGLAKNIPFYISATDMASRFDASGTDNKKFWYEVTRVSGNTTESSPPVALFYKYPAPGEADTDGGMPFNQGLKLPVSSEGFIDKTVVGDGLYVTVLEYFNQSIGDIVVLAFGSLTLEAEVTAPGDVVFELTPDMLATLASTNTLMVRYEIIDRVENTSGWSDALVLPFKPGVILLAAPVFLEADFNDVIDHDALEGFAKVEVSGKFTSSDLIELTLQGHAKGGEAVTHTFRKTLLVDAREISFEIDNEWIRNLIGGSLSATYTLTRAGKIQPSKQADARIRGTSQPLGLPVVEPLIDNTLPVDTPEATVHVAAYWPLKAGAKVELRWQTTDKDGIGALFIFQVIVAEPSKPVVFKVPARYISPYANQPLLVQNTITNPGEIEVTSQLLELKFGAAAKIELLAPFLVKPAVSPIDVMISQDGVVVRVEHLGAIEGDKARLVEVNAPAGEPPFELKLFNNNQRTNTLLTQAFLAARHGRTDVRLRWNLNRGGQQVDQSPILTVEIKKIENEDVRFPMPVVAGQTGQVLDITSLRATDNLTIDPWIGQRVRQPVWLSYGGTGNDGKPVQDTVWNGQPLESASGVKVPVNLQWLRGLKDGSEVTISFWASMSDKPELATAVLFPVRRYAVKSLILTAPQLLHLPSQNLNVDDIPDTGIDIQVPAYSGMSAGQTVIVHLQGSGQSHSTFPQTVASVTPLTFSIPRSVCIANAGRRVEVTYLVNNQLRSPELSLSFLPDTWRDSDGDLSRWAFGPASSTARFVYGYYENYTYGAGGNSGVLLSQTFQFSAARTYRLGYSVANVSPQPDNLPPVISARFSSGVPIFPPFTVPRTSQYYPQTTTFRVQSSGTHTIQIVNHEDRGGYGGAQGGNDFQIANIFVQRL
ncbi:Uncharacterised protein [Pseudomonas fluorescens]|uniref:Uncharacterized protein n=1 Tax=Pseudomonas fluorescens TaxID=294 RepID=A0A3S4P6E3_PSEFL|nr:hypothetical protein [Pseudomonas fluorescens]VEF09781.1 Uncharacterised protein [Pseudomonas fluorescens]